MAAKRLKKEKFWTCLKGEDWSKCSDSEWIDHFGYETEVVRWTGAEKNHLGGSPFLRALYKDTVFVMLVRKKRDYAHK